MKFLKSILISFISLFLIIGIAQAVSIFQIWQGGTGINTTNAGDILYANINNSLTTLNKGIDGQVLTLSSGIPAWTGVGGGDLKADGTVPLTADWDAGNSLYDITAVEFKGALIGNADTVTNATLSTALTVNTGTLTLTANNANNSVLTIGAGASSISGANTGDQDLSGKADTDQTMYIGTTAVAINRATNALTLAGITLTTPDIGTPSAGTLTNCSFPTLNQNTTGQAGTVATIDGLAPDTATTQATQGAITSLGTLTGLTMGGNIVAGDHSITGLADPTADQDAETKKHIEDNYIPFSDILMPLNYNGGKRLYIPELNTLFYKADTRMTVSQTGFNTWTATNLFNLNYDTFNEISVSGTGVVTIDVTPEWGANGITYPQGYIVVSFYYIYIPDSVSGRIKDKDDNWHSLTNPVNISNKSGRAIWRMTVPANSYGEIFEITINARADIATKLTQIDYFAFRPTTQKLPWQI